MAGEPLAKLGKCVCGGRAAQLDCQRWRRGTGLRRQCPRQRGHKRKQQTPPTQPRCGANRQPGCRKSQGRSHGVPKYSRGRDVGAGQAGHRDIRPKSDSRGGEFAFNGYDCSTSERRSEGQAISERGAADPGVPAGAAIGGPKRPRPRPAAVHSRLSCGAARPWEQVGDRFDMSQDPVRRTDLAAGAHVSRRRCESGSGDGCQIVLAGHVIASARLRGRDRPSCTPGFPLWIPLQHGLRIALLEGAPMAEFDGEPSRTRSSRIQDS